MPPSKPNGHEPESLGSPPANEGVGERTASRTLASLRGAQIVIDGESASEFEAFRGRLLDEFPEGGVLAEMLVEQLATLLWRLRRVAGFEAGLLSWIQHQQAQVYDTDGLSLGGHFFPSDRRGLASSAETADRSKRHRRHVIGRAMEVAVIKADALGRMGRYEVHLVRQAERILTELRRLQSPQLRR